VRSVRHPSSSLLRCPWERRSAPGGGISKNPKPIFFSLRRSSSSSNPFHRRPLRQQRRRRPLRRPFRSSRRLFVAVVVHLSARRCCLRPSRGRRPRGTCSSRIRPPRRSARRSPLRPPQIRPSRIQRRPTIVPSPLGLLRRRIVSARPRRSSSAPDPPAIASARRGSVAAPSAGRRRGWLRLPPVVAAAVAAGLVLVPPARPRSSVRAARPRPAFLCSRAPLGARGRGGHLPHPRRGFAGRLLRPACACCCFSAAAGPITFPGLQIGRRLAGSSLCSCPLGLGAAEARRPASPPVPCHRAGILLCCPEAIFCLLLSARAAASICHISESFA